VPGGFYHVFSKGSNGGALFLYDSDRIDFLAYVATIIERYELECLAYALMTNHFHGLFRTPERLEPTLSKALRDLNGTHARRFNRRYRREAHAFRNRFGAVLQESAEQLLWTARYVVLNPVAAGLCSEASEWPWTSYRATAGLEPAPGFLSVSRLLSFFSNKPAVAAAKYVEFVNGRAGA
jgi:REP element-mobilizing transposase RayT